MRHALVRKLVLIAAVSMLAGCMEDPGFYEPVVMEGPVKHKHVRHVEHHKKHLEHHQKHVEHKTTVEHHATSKVAKDPAVHADEMPMVHSGSTSNKAAAVPPTL